MSNKLIVVCLLIVLACFCSCKAPSPRPAEKNDTVEQDTRKETPLASADAPPQINSGSAEKEALATDVAKTKSRQINILYWGAWEAALVPLAVSGKEMGGLPYLVAMVKKLATPDTLVCATGDLFSGDAKDKRPVVPALNLAGLQVTTLGNLELNYGASGLQKQLQAAKFNMLSANVYHGGKRLFTPYVIKRVGDVRVGIIGLTTQEAAIQVAPDMIAGLSFKDPIKEMQNCLQELAGKADLLVVLSNLRFQEDVALARACPDIHVILGRYDVTPDHLAKKIKNVFIARINNKQGIELGEVIMTEADGRWSCRSNRNYRLGRQSSDCQGLTPDAAAQRLVQEWQYQERELREKLCDNKILLLGEYQKVRQQETNLGNLIADILLASRPGADIAVVNSGCIRASIPSGAITRGELLTALPYKNKIVELSLRGETVKEMLENAVAQYQKVSGAFLQVAGLSFSFDPGREKFARVVEIKIQGELLKPEKEYRVVTLDYIASGGDDYVMLKDKPQRYIGQEPIQQIIADYLKRRREININLEGRIKIISKGAKE